jgi:hypothetical protein
MAYQHHGNTADWLLNVTVCFDKTEMKLGRDVT